MYKKLFCNPTIFVQLINENEIVNVIWSHGVHVAGT